MRPRWPVQFGTITPLRSAEEAAHHDVRSHDRPRYAVAEVDSEVATRASPCETPEKRFSRSLQGISIATRTAACHARPRVSAPVHRFAMRKRHRRALQLKTAPRATRTLRCSSHRIPCSVRHRMPHSDHVRVSSFRVRLSTGEQSTITDDHGDQLLGRSVPFRAVDQYASACLHRGVSRLRPHPAADRKQRIDRSHQVNRLPFISLSLRTKRKHSFKKVNVAERQTKARESSAATAAAAATNALRSTGDHHSSVGLRLPTLAAALPGHAAGDGPRQSLRRCSSERVDRIKS